MQLQRVKIPKYFQCQSCNKGAALTVMTICVSDSDIIETVKQAHATINPMCLALNPLIIFDNALIPSEQLFKDKAETKSNLIVKP